MYKWIRSFVVVLLVSNLILQPVIVYSASSPWSPTNSYTLSLSEKLSNTTFDTNTDNWSATQSYTLNDEFTTARSAGAVNGTSAEPTGGTRTVVDTESKLTIGSGTLTFASGATTPTEGDPAVWYSSIVRVPGKIFLGSVNVSALTNSLQVGFDTNNSGVIGENALQFRSAAMIRLYDQSTTQVVGDSLTLSTEYKYSMVLRATGTFVFVKGGTQYPNWTLLYIIPTKNTSTLYPTIQSVGATAIVDNIRIPTATWLPTPLAYDTFTRADGAIGVVRQRGRTRKPPRL